MLSLTQNGGGGRKGKKPVAMLVAGAQIVELDKRCGIHKKQMGQKVQLK